MTRWSTIAALWMLAAGCGPSLAEENVVACRAATRAERSVLGSCVSDLGDEDCEAYDTVACDWTEHFRCRRDMAYEVEDCGSSGAVDDWLDSLETCPPADCGDLDADLAPLGDDDDDDDNDDDDDRR